MGFFSSAFGKQRQREEKESKQTTTQAFPLRWTASLSDHHLLGSRFQTGNQPNSVFIQKLPQRDHCKTFTTRQLKQHYITALLLNYSFKPRVLTQVYSLLLKRNSWGFLRQTYVLLCSVAGQQLVGQ